MKLKDVAKFLHAKARQNGKASCRLGKGLQLTLVYRERDIVLKLAREGVEPSPVEVRTCKSYFFGDDVELTNQAQQGNQIYIAVERETQA